MFIKNIKYKILNKLNNFKSIKNHVIAYTPQQNSVIPEMPSNSENKEEIYKWIKECIGYFKEWYQPVDFKNGVIAHVTTPPDWQPVPKLLNDNSRGISKWNYIIKKHIPEVTGKRILDLGCSSGVYCIELARMGAKEVIGIDRNIYIKHRSTNIPPSQNVIAQANFVKKSFELLENTKYPITYIAHDIGKIADLKLGRFDFILALAVVYHELDKMPNLIKELANMTDHLILQASQAHSGDLGKWANKLQQAQMLIEAGFTNIEIDAPINYQLPMIIGKK